MNDENFPEGIDTVEDVPRSAVKPPRKSPGRPFTKENAKEFALSAAKAKRLRKEARAKLLHGLVAEEIDMVEELKKAIRDNDEVKINIVEKALRLVGLHHDQSDEARIQNLHVDAKTDSKVSGAVNITVKGLDGD